MDTSMAINRILLPRKRHLANPNATIAEDATVPMVATTEINSELRKNTPKLIPAKPFQPFRQQNQYPDRSPFISQPGKIRLDSDFPQQRVDDSVDCEHSLPEDRYGDRSADNRRQIIRCSVKSRHLCGPQQNQRHDQREHQADRNRYKSKEKCHLQGCHIDRVICKHLYEVINPYKLRF